ncbi:branched-chain amino acid aminotransferase [Cystoisospora suis]|uniref:Branched-chain amino acid aminotransferase n=1 Tax=Cystoisospora suis TaxID=483139 RepID=A0A2C6L804_9APIC|nr:branched-chain amino acid aminotransferase [Cystoisospora suis]
MSPSSRVIIMMRGGRAETLFRSFSSLAALSPMPKVQTPPPPRLNDLRFDQLTIRRKTEDLPPLPSKDSLHFGQVFTDHMIEADWNDQHGWYPPILKPLAPVSLHPAISSIHYAVSAFEGLKAFRSLNDRILLFRPYDHAKRLNRSCSRVCLPEFSIDSFVSLCKALVRIDNRYIFKDRGLSLYLRPVVFSTYPALGVYPPRMAKMIILASPTGGYFSSTTPLPKLYVELHRTRSWPGGVGNHKVSSNYAPTLRPYQDRMQEGYQQILWTVPERDDYLWCEGGAMSLFLYWRNEEGKDELATPALDGDLILPGIVRDTVLNLTKENYPSLRVAERKILMRRDFVKAYNENRVYEVFCTGTGATVTPIGSIHFDGIDYNCMQSDLSKSLSRRIYEDIFNIQYGDVGDHPYLEEC